MYGDSDKALWLKLIFAISNCLVCDALMHYFDSKTCEGTMSLNFEITGLRCKFNGDGMYYYNHRHGESVERLIVNKLTLQSCIYIPKDDHLQEVIIQSGSTELFKSGSK